MRTLASAAAVTLLALAMAGAQTPRTDPQAGLIVGQVVDAGTSRPIAGAVVGISGNISTPDGRPLSSSRVLTTPDAVSRPPRRQFQPHATKRDTSRAHGQVRLKRANERAAWSSAWRTPIAGTVVDEGQA
jgi:hypothetical protein